MAKSLGLLKKHKVLDDYDLPKDEVDLLWK